MKDLHINPAPALHPAWSVAIPLSLYLIMRYVPGLDYTLSVPFEHFMIVAIVSVLTTVVAIAIGVAGVRLRNQQVIFVSVAFTSLAILFTLHALSTPNILLPFTRIVGIAAIMSIFLMSLWLWVSSLPSDSWIALRTGHMGRALIVFWTLTLAALAVATFNNPDLVAFVPVDSSPLKWLVTAITLFFALSASSRYWQSYRYANFPFQSGIAHVGGLIAVSEIIMITGEVWQISWWLYHVLLLLAVIIATAGLLKQYHRGASMVLSVTGLFSTDITERLDAGISPSVRTLVAETEAKDTYTAGHSRRVAEAALEFGAYMCYPPEKLRALAQGSILHDVGKLATPNDLLNKAGKLNDEERAEIERHPMNGFEIGRQLGFMQEELAIIRSHHERYDGAGYPDKLAGDEIPELARILAVVDVYDALTSDRAYRPAWEQDKAIEYINTHRGTHFDPNCVDAWIKMMEEK